MIEIATGAAFLMSSLYGAGQANAQTAVMANAPAKQESAVIRSINPKNTKEVENYIRQEFTDTPILVEIARCESTFRQFDSTTGKVIRGTVNRADVGVMQINERYHADTADRMGTDIYSVEGNVAFAKYLYKKYGTSPWSASQKCWSATGPLAQK